jgi:diguanylate cyclase (GGDEF)-like protein
MDGTPRDRRSWVRAVRAWPIWALPRWLVVFIMSVIVADALAMGEAAASTTIRVHDIVLFCFLIGSSAATVELTRRSGENAGLVKDVHGIWELPIALLLPPPYGLIAPFPRLALTQWRTRRGFVYRRVFSAAAISLSFGAASMMFHKLAPVVAGSTSGSVAHALSWSLLALACAVARTAINKFLVMTAVKGSQPSVSVRAMTLRREPLYNDLAELSAGILVAYGVATNPFLAPVALPIVTLLHRSSRHAQLVNDSRLDSKTGLLNAGTWEREAAVEVARAVRAQTPLAVALLDIDHFKVVNDTHGHLVGDHTLREIARTFKILLREYDLAGRFGGEEFVLLLPHTHDLDAYHIAERMRAHIAAMPIYATEGDGAEPVRVTVSIGVAALNGTRRELTDLLAAADVALYRAKQGGRDRVHMINAAAMAGGE